MYCLSVLQIACLVLLGWSLLVGARTLNFTQPAGCYAVIAHVLLRSEEKQPGHSNLSITQSRNPVSKMAEDAALDDEFKRIIAEMKPHARSLSQKSGSRKTILNKAHH